MSNGFLEVNLLMCHGNTPDLLGSYSHQIPKVFVDSFGIPGLCDHVYDPFSTVFLHAHIPMPY